MNWSNHDFNVGSSGSRRRRRTDSDEKITGTESGQHWYFAGDSSVASASRDGRSDNIQHERVVDPLFSAGAGSLPRRGMSASAVDHQEVPFSKALIDCSSEVISILAAGGGTEREIEESLKPTATRQALDWSPADSDGIDDDFLEADFGETVAGIQGVFEKSSLFSNCYSDQGVALPVVGQSASMRNSNNGHITIPQFPEARNVAAIRQTVMEETTQSPATNRTKRTRDMSITYSDDDDIKAPPFSDKHHIFEQSSQDDDAQARRADYRLRQDATVTHRVGLPGLPDNADENMCGKKVSYTNMGSVNDSSRQGAGKKQQEQWMQRYEELLEYRAEHGHVNVPFSYKGHPALAQWIKRQRYQYKCMSKGKHSHMTPERLKLLESVGFAWDSHAHAFEENFEKLVEFKRKTGHCMVPTREQQLFAWCKRQRRQYRSWLAGRQSTLTEERVQRLANLGFQWTIEQEQDKYEKND